MGGHNQGSVAPPPQTSSPSGRASQGQQAQSTGGSVRVHENRQAGEVHFHDDAANLKVAVPTPEYFSKFRQLEDDPDPNKPAVFTDPGRKTMAVITPAVSGKTLDFQVEVKKIQLGKGYQTLKQIADDADTNQGG